VPNWYVTREKVKATLPINDGTRDDLIDGYIAAASRAFDRATHQFYIPRNQTRSYSWPQAGHGGGVLDLDAPLISVDSLTKDDDDETAIQAADYFLEPANSGPPYHWIEIDQSSAAFFSFKNTTQRAIRVSGLWGAHSENVPAGALAANLASTTTTSLAVTDSSLVHVGDTLLNRAEQMFVSGRSTLDTGTNTAGSPTASMSDQTIAVGDGSAVKTGEVILIDSERMLVLSVTDNNLSVVRAWDGTSLAVHSSGVDVYAFRTLTISRGENGTTAVDTHQSADELVAYRAPADVRSAVEARALSDFVQASGGWTGIQGGGEASAETKRSALSGIWSQAVRGHRRHLLGSSS
jgi:hypothetical protein